MELHYVMNKLYWNNTETMMNRDENIEKSQLIPTRIIIFLELWSSEF